MSTVLDIVGSSQFCDFLDKVCDYAYTQGIRSETCRYLRWKCTDSARLVEKLRILQISGECPEAAGRVLEFIAEHLPTIQLGEQIASAMTEEPA